MKTIDPAVRNSVLHRYGRAIVHMRQQLEEARFGLVFGSGASAPLGFPTWDVLIARIAEHPEVDASRLLEQQSSHSSRSQLLYQAFRAKVGNTAEIDSANQFNRMEMEVRARWQKIVHDCLYQDVPHDLAEIKERDQYLWALLPVIKRTRLTITYNFDNSLERLLSDYRTPEEREESRGYVTIWNALIQMYPRDGVIYHPNGFLPDNLQERPSEDLVFLEDTFADQLIESMHGHYASLVHHLAQTTRLLIGLSLDDATLKHLLRRNAQMFPGHFHYYVAYVRDGDDQNEAFQAATSDSNFAVYNLVTLFLNSAEIAALGQLLVMKPEDFNHLAEEVGVPAVYRYLVTGSVSVGKSTTVSQFRSLGTHDEWLEQRPPGMEKDPSKAKADEIARIDEWVFNQLSLKNKRLLDLKSGLHIVDRAPLDAFAFTPLDQWRDKALKIRAAIRPGQSNKSLCGAHIIFMIGDPDVMEVRALARHKVTTAELLRKQQLLLEQVYKSLPSGVSIIDTRDKSVQQVAKEVARVIHQRRYEEAPMQQWLDDAAAGNVAIPGLMGEGDQQV